MDYVPTLRLSFLTRGWLIGCSAHLTLITANKNYQIPDSTKRIRGHSYNHLPLGVASLIPLHHAWPTLETNINLKPSHTQFQRYSLFSRVSPNLLVR